MEFEKLTDKIEFKSNVDATLYNLFDELCHKLGHNPKEYTKLINSRARGIEILTTWIETGDYILWREVYPENTIRGKDSRVRIKIISLDKRTNRDKMINEYDIRRRIFGYNPAVVGWYLFSKIGEAAYFNEEYHRQEPDQNKVKETLEELIKFIKNPDLPSPLLPT